jgi:hypothetical protein
VPAPNYIYYLLNAVTAVAVFGTLRQGWQRLRERADRPWLSDVKLVVVGLWVFVTLAAWLWYWQSTVVTGRQIYALLPVLSFSLIRGMAGMIPPRWRAHFATLTMGAALALAAGALVGILIPAYRPAPQWTEQQIDSVIQHRLDWQFAGAATLVGYRLSPDVARLGDEVVVTLYWRVMKTPEHNFTTFVHLLGQDNAPVGARDTYPGLGNSPTRYWRPGDLIADAIPIPISSDATGPILLDLEAGLYDLETGGRLRVIDSSGGVVASPRLGVVKLAGPVESQVAPAHTINAAFANGPELIGYDLSATGLKAGETITVTLDWSSSGPLDDDYTIFLHLVDMAGEVIAQGDGPPRGGRYPTSVWAPGERFTDAHVIALPPDARAGTYFVRVGLYQPANNSRRLLADGSDHVQLNQSITVR